MDSPCRARERARSEHSKPAARPPSTLGPRTAPRRARTRAIASLGALVALAGCTALPPALQHSLQESLEAADPNAPGAVAKRTEPVVSDMVSALVQLRDPVRTTVQVGPPAGTQPNDAIRATLVDALAAAGYGIQRVPADQGANFLDWSYAAGDAGPDAGGASLATRLSIGAVTLERDYLATDDGFVAASPLTVSGTRGPVGLDDDARLPGTDPAHSRIVYAGDARALANGTDLAVPIISLVTDDVVRGLTAAATGRSARRGLPSRQAINSNRVEVSNLYFGNGAFDALRGDMASVASGIIVFGDDSMRLGAVGKREVRAFVEDFSADTDMISLVGCSNGPTKLAIGNEGLALGRSARVVEELVTLGVERSRILDEGCWAGRSAGKRFPSRGVVIELLRAKA